MEKNTQQVLLPALVVVIIFVILGQWAPIANSQTVQIISASPGQTVSYQGQGSPNSQVTMEVSATISVGVSNNHYVSHMNGVNIPGGSRFSISASPVDSLTISGSISGLPFSTSIQGNVNGHTGSASLSNIPAGTYSITVSGIANGSGPVSVTVRASQPQNVGADGTFKASISTSGLPVAVYSVKQNSQEVARVYLGVQAPATPTPTATITVTPSPNGTITPVPSITPGMNTTITPEPVKITPTPMPNQGNNTFLGIQLPSFNLFGGSPSASGSPSAQPPGTEAVAGGQESTVTTILIYIGAIVAGLLIGYAVVFLAFKK
ncbi:hypothetical protein MCP_0879 [Methanocella paludicola SANAE]|uniref:Uncharacterized protein n=1 Tax=Methanocella paludicola (strain DSM 17711 / JCM 13418 / NBRC 101707 / SANAE) TaxID=304371 RepID=D1YWX9_METPS|nr:hypothetical protein [Methanocella paludicola]BAI60951.1 hypothetical protein MCP_0879 [Methanocella paludicola SANAE]